MAIQSKILKTGKNGSGLYVNSKGQKVSMKTQLSPEQIEACGDDLVKLNFFQTIKDLKIEDFFKNSQAFYSVSKALFSVEERHKASDLTMLPTTVEEYHATRKKFVEMVNSAKESLGLSDELCKHLMGSYSRFVNGAIKDDMANNNISYPNEFKSQVSKDAEQEVRDNEGFETSVQRRLFVSEVNQRVNDSKESYFLASKIPALEDKERKLVKKQHELYQRYNDAKKDEQELKNAISNEIDKLNVEYSKLKEELDGARQAKTTIASLEAWLDEKCEGLMSAVSVGDDKINQYDASVVAQEIRALWNEWKIQNKQSENSQQPENK